MNFYDLSAKLRAIDESTVAECGDMMPMIAHAPQQSDSVTMNVSMNGSGAGGIKDLMDILRNIEQAADDQEEPMVAEPHGMDGDVDIVLGTDEDMLADPKTQDSGAGAGDESYGNSAPGGSDARQFGLDAVTRKGDDMHSKGDVKRLRVNGAENPLQEGLVERLQDLYASIKETKGATTYTVAYKDSKKPGKSHSTEVKATSAAEAKAAFQDWDSTNRFTYLGARPNVSTVHEGNDLEPIQDKYNKYKK